MKILFLTDLEHSGIESRLKFFYDAGHTISVFSLQPPIKKRSLLKLDSIDIYSLFRNRHGGKRCLKSKEAMASIKDCIKKTGPDIIYAFFVNYYGWLAYLSGFHPYVITPMNTDIHSYQSLPVKEKFLTYMSLLHSDGIISVSDDIKEKICRMGIKHKNHIVSWRGVDTKIFMPHLVNLRFTKRLCKKNVLPFIFSPRAFQVNYNIDIIIKAMPKILRKYPRAVLLLSSYRVNNMQYERSLKLLAKKLRLSKNIIFLKEQTQHQMSDLYNITRCFISIPSHDGTPATLHEGMACGSIPVLSNLTTTNRWVKNNKNGIIVKDLSPDGVARVVVRAIRIDNDRRERIARINRLAIIHKASFLRYRHKEENFLKKIIISDQKNKAMHSY